MKNTNRDVGFCLVPNQARLFRSITSSRQVSGRRSSSLQRPALSTVASPSSPPAALKDLRQEQQRPCDTNAHGAITQAVQGNATVGVLSRDSSWSKNGRLDAYRLRGSIMAAGRQGKWAEVLRVLGRWERQANTRAKLDTKTYNIAVSALGKCGRWREAIATLDRMRGMGVPPDVYSWNTAISACGRVGEWEQALKMLARMEENGCEARPDIFTYNGAIGAVAKAGRWTQALELLERIDDRGLTPDVISYTSTMSACDKAGEWQRALDIMGLMLERRVEPNIVSYGAAISACARGGCWQKALCLLREVPSRGLTANAHVYGSAMHACVKGGEHKRALPLLAEMVNAGVVPDAVAFTAAMTAVGDWTAALRLLEIMKSQGVSPDTVAYNAALSAVARSGREDVALALLEEMRTNGCSPNLVSFNTAIDACASRGNWREAVRLLEVEMPAAKVKPDVISLTSAIHACCGPVGNWEKAYQLLDGMWQDDTGPRPNKRTYDLVIQACGNGGEWELAVALVDDMRDLGIKPDAQTFNIAAAACARAGESLAAETLVASMWRSGVAPDEFSYASLVAACDRAGEWKRAIKIFDEARYVRGVRPSLQIYGALLSTLTSAEQWMKASLYFDRMIADGIVPDATAACKGALAAAELRDGRRALSILEGEKPQRLRERRVGSEARSADDPMVDSPSEAGAKAKGCRRARVEGEQGAEAEGEPGVRVDGEKKRGGWEAATPSLLNSVLHALDSAGEDAAVLETVERGREKGVKLNGGVYRSALKACGNLGDHDRATALLGRMVEEERITPDIVHWNHALRASATTARWREARSLLEEMRSCDISPDEFSYSMALKACSAGLWSGDSWSNSGWLTPDEKDQEEDEELSPILRAEGSSDAGRRGGLPAGGRAKNAIELLQEMESLGIRVRERSFNLAMSACLEGHRDGCAETGHEKPPDADIRLAEAALSLFDQLIKIGETPTVLSYALALKACARTANKSRASELLFDMLQAAKDGSSEGPGANAPLHIRSGHLASAIAAYNAADDGTGAQELWRQARRWGVSPRSLG